MKNYQIIQTLDIKYQWMLRSFDDECLFVTLCNFIANSSQSCYSYLVINIHIEKNKFSSNLLIINHNVLMLIFSKKIITVFVFYCRAHYYQQTNSFWVCIRLTNEYFRKVENLNLVR